MSFEGLPSGLEGFRQCFTANGRLVIEHINFCEPSSQGVNIQVAESTLGPGLVEHHLQAVSNQECKMCKDIFG